MVLRGATQQILDEAERSLHDALCVLTQTVKETRTVFGGGACLTLLALAWLLQSTADAPPFFFLDSHTSNPPLHIVGCSEMLMATAVENLARTTAGKEAAAMQAFANALRQLPTIIADNAGFDSQQLVAELRAAHAEGKNTLGLDMETGKVSARGRRRAACRVSCLLPQP